MHARDILDESDEILNVKHELIYTIGNPTPVENHPDRWIVIQEIFDLIQLHFETAEVSLQDFEFERQEQGRFGSIRILNMVAGKKLLQEIADKIIDGKEFSAMYILDTVLIKMFRSTSHYFFPSLPYRNAVTGCTVHLRPQNDGGASVLTPSIFWQQ